MKRAILLAAALAGCASDHSLHTLMIDGNKVKSVKESTVAPDDAYRKGYLAGIEAVHKALEGTGPYSLTMRPEPVYRGPAYLRVYLKPMKIDNVYYPEGWYLVEAVPGSVSEYHYAPPPAGVQRTPSAKRTAPKRDDGMGVPLDR